ncbi:MAG TPA: hypothetical protein VIK94_04290 [Bacilli bacterium]
MNLIIGTIVMTVIIFGLYKIINNHLRTLTNYSVISLIVFFIAIVISYDGDIDRFIYDYFCPLIIPIILYGIYHYKRSYDEENKAHNEKIILFQFQKIISLIITLIALQTFGLVMILKFVFTFSINYIFIITLGIAVIILSGLTISLYRYHTEKIIIISKNNVYQYEIPDKTYIINRSEFLDESVRRVGIVYWKNENREVHYLYKVNNDTYDFEEGSPLYKDIIPMIHDNTYNIIIIRIRDEKITKAFTRYRKVLKK